MDFYTILEEIEEGYAFNPFSGKVDDKWVGGAVSIDFLNEHFSQFETVQEMIDATESEGLKLFFTWLRDEKGILN